MKRIVFFLVIPLVAGFVSCKKEDAPVIKYIIETISGSGGTVNPLGKIEVIQGDSLAVTLKPDSGYDVDVVKVDGNIEPIPTNLIYNFSEVIANHKLEVTFKKTVVDVKYNVDVTFGSGGTVSPNGSLQISNGLGVNFTFTPDPGFAPDSIVVNGKSSPLTGNTYTLSNITEDTKVQVVFTKTNLWYLIQGPWKMSKLEERNIGTIDWYNQTFSYEKTLFVLMTYDAQYKYKVINPQGGNVVGDGPYTITADSLIWGQPMGQYRADGIRNKIILLNDNILELKYVSKFYDQNGTYVPSRNIEFQATYIH
jgi:hypothetical protein